MLLVAFSCLSNLNFQSGCLFELHCIAIVRPTATIMLETTIRLAVTAIVVGIIIGAIVFESNSGQSMDSRWIETKWGLEAE